MTRVEFAKVMSYLAVATGKPIASDEKAATERLEVYFDLLGSIPKAVLEDAAKQVVKAHAWATFPSVAELYQAASKIVSQALGSISPVEAWDLAYRAICKCDPGLTGPYAVGDKLYNSQVEYLMSQLPPVAANVVQGMGGLKLLANADPNFLRPQFMKTHERVVTDMKEQALLPRPQAEQIQNTVSVINKIGLMPNDKAG